MKILFLTDPAPDYLADLLYIGFCRVLGNNRVVDFPLKPAYHQPDRRVHYIPQVPAHPYQQNDIVAFLQGRQFDLAILSSPRPGVMATFESLRRRVSFPPMVLFDGEDDAFVRQNAWNDSRSVLYFKRELKLPTESGIRVRWQHWMGGSRLPKWRDRLFPLPLSVALEQVPEIQPCERVVDVSYVARVSHQKRKQAVDALTEAPGIRFEGGVYAEATDRRSKLVTGFPQVWAKLMGDPVIPIHERGEKLSPQAYYDLLMRSKMALSIRGGGFDTLRYWEIVATKTLLLSEQPDIEIPNNFVHGKHALFFKPDLSDLIDLVRTYAKDEGARTAMAQAGYDHLMRYHTCERRAEYVLDICRRLM